MLTGRDPNGRIAAWDTARDTATPLERVVFEGDGFEVGSFRCRASHPSFRDAGPIRDHCAFVFPRTAVWIRHEGRRRFAADSGVVAFYNPRHPYTRAAIDPAGDFCEWFAVDAEMVMETARELDPAIEERPRLPFRFSHGPVDADTYLAQRRVFESLDRGLWTDALEVEETVLGLLGRVLRLAYSAYLGGLTPPQDVGGRQRDLADWVRTIVAARLASALTLGELAREIGVSPYYLCRVFRKTTGRTIHAYREQLRLRAALAALARRGTDLTELALDLGYSSHSHFTASFRKAFGSAPSLVRRRLTSGALGTAMP